MAKIQVLKLNIDSFLLLQVRFFGCNLYYMSYRVTEAYVLIFFTYNINVKYLITNPIMHDQMKHVEIDFHFIQDLGLANKLDMRYTPTTDQVVDIFIKPLWKSQFILLKIKLMVMSLPWFVRVCLTMNSMLTIGHCNVV